MTRRADLAAAAGRLAVGWVTMLIMSTVPIPSSALAQVAQHADDLDRATSFYTLLLRAGPIGAFDPPGLVFFDLGGTRLLLESAAPSATLYLQVADVHAEIDRLRTAGVAIESDPHIIFSHPDDTLGPAGTDEWQAFVRDTEGNLVGLISHTPSPGHDADR